MKTAELMEIALKAGEILLVSGAEIYRVEETVLRILKSYDAEGDCFILLSGIFITARNFEDQGVTTVIKRIEEQKNDLKKIEMVNSLSRRIEKEKPPYSEVIKALNEIENAGEYGFPLKTMASGFSGLIYILLLGGTIYEALAGFAVSLSVFLIKTLLEKLGLFLFAVYFASGFVAGVGAAIGANFMNFDIYRTITGSIMILVPGMAITNGIKDALYGDTVSSIYRLADALFIAVAVAGGVVIALAAVARFF